MTITVATLVIVATGGWMLARSSLFALERVEVAGTKTLSRAEVIRASGLKTGSSMLSLDLGAVRARVARLPLVDSVEVSKPAPSHVRILVNERTPAFVLETIHGLYRIDAKAVVLGVTLSVDRSLPMIRSLSHGPLDAGDRIRTPDVANALALWSALPVSLRSGVPLVEVEPGGFTVVHEDLTVRFGPFDRIDQKIEAVRLVVERARAAKERLIAIDVRSPGRPAAIVA